MIILRKNDTHFLCDRPIYARILFHTSCVSGVSDVARSPVVFTVYSIDRSGRVSSYEIRDRVSPSSIFVGSVEISRRKSVK